MSDEFEILGFLCVLTVVLAIVTVVGHGIWVLLAVIFRAVFGTAQKRSATSGRNTQLDDVRASIRQLERLHERGQITDRLYNGVVKLLQTEESQLIGGAAPPPQPEARSAPTIAPAAEPPKVVAPPSAKPAPPRAIGPAAASQPEVASEISVAQPPVPAAPGQDAAKAPADEGVIDAVLVPDDEPAPSSPAVTPTPPSATVPAAASTAIPEAPSAAQSADLPELVLDQPAIAKALGPTELPAASAPARPPAERPPHRPLSSMLQAFMEERNILWGELIGGMLIVVCAIGLVIGLWSTLKNVPFFPPFVFLGVTAGIFGAGIYTLRRWRLETTSRGLLIVAVLLIPLNFLAAIALGTEQSIHSPLYLVAVSIGLAAFGGIAYGAGRVLVPHGAWLFVVVVLGTSAAQIIINRTVVPGMTAGEINSVFGIPLGCFLVGTLTHLYFMRQRKQLSRRLANESFILLGASVFALLAALSLLVHKCSGSVAGIRDALAVLAPALTMLASVILAFGLVVHLRVTGAKLAPFRAAGTWLAVLGGALMLCLLILVWPDPVRLLLIAAIAFIVLTVMGMLARFPVLYCPAVVSFALAVFVTFHVYGGELDSTATTRDMIRAFFLGRSCVLFASLATAAVGMAWLLRRVRRDADAVPILWGLTPMAAAAAISSLITGFRSAGGGNDAVLASIVLALIAIGALGAGASVRRGWVTCTGSVLLLVALLQVFSFNPGVRWLLRAVMPTAIAAGLLPFLLHATVSCLAAIAPSFPSCRKLLGAADARDMRRPFVLPLCVCALVTSSLVVLPALLFPLDRTNEWHAICACWIALIWLVIAVLLRWQVMFWAFQAMATASLCLTVRAFFRPGLWDGTILFSLPHIMAQLAALASWSALWSIVRRDCRKWLWLHTLMNPGWPSVDRLCLYLAVFGVVVIAVAGCLPGLDAEVGSYLRGNLGLDSGSVLLLRAFTFLGLHAGEASALILALFLVWSLGALAAWLLGAFRRNRQAVAMLLVTALGIILVWLFARFGIYMWEFQEVGIRFAATDTMWRLLLLVAVALAVAFMNRVSTVDLVGLICLAFSIPLLCAAWFESVGAVASAVSWGMAICGCVVATLLWARKPVSVFVLRRGWLSALQLRSIRVDPLSALALLIGTLPVLLISLAQIMRILENRPIDLAILESIAGKAYLLWWFGGPIGIVAITLIGYALRERSPAFALSGSLLINAAVTLASACLVWLPGQASDAYLVVTLLQWNAMALGIVGLCWLSGRRRIEAVTRPGETGWQLYFGLPLGIQVWLLLLITAFLTVWAVFLVVLFPDHLPQSAAMLSGVRGWTVLLLATVVAGWYFRSRMPEWDVHLGICVALSTVALAAAAMYSRNTSQNWLAFHVLSGGWLFVAISAGVAAWVGTLARTNDGAGGTVLTKAADKPTVWAACRDWSSRSASSLAVWATAIGMGVVLLAIHGNWSSPEGPDPNAPWWSAMLVSGAALLATALAIRARNQPYAYGSVVLVALAALFVLTSVEADPSFATVAQLLQFITAAVVVMSGLWVAVELWWQRRKSSVFDPQPNRVPVHHTVGVVAVALLAVLLAVCLLVRIFDPAETRPEMAFDNLRVVSGLGGWMALTAVGLLLAVSLWDRTAHHVVPCLYVWGLVVAAMIVNRVDPLRETTVFGVACACGIYVLVCGLLWSTRKSLAQAGRPLRVAAPESASSRIGLWLPACSLILAGLTAFIAVGGSLEFDRLSFRLAGTMAVAMAAVGIAITADAPGRRVLQMASLGLGVCAAVAFGWAVMVPDATPHAWLPRTVRLMVMLAVSAFAYAAVLPRVVPKASDWNLAVRRAAVFVGGATGATLLMVLALEAVHFDPNATAPALQIAIVATALVGLIVGLITLAVQRGPEPLGLSDNGRMAYVYAAEIVAALLFLHIYLTMPMLFRGILRPYWSLIVMGIAFFGVGAGEALRRSGVKVLSEPLTRTGAFLPLLPVLGFWAITLNPTAMGFAGMLFTVGILYVLLSMWRKSFAYVVCAALAGNAMLWALLVARGTTVLMHPQFFLIPPAVCVLVAVQLNRDRLSESQRTAARYLALLVIYVASTGELFLPATKDLIWPPILLASLSVLGALVGMLFRVRAFVYLGTLFLMMSILRMVWHAAQHIGHTWPWWAFGIALGILIFVVFAVFERKRQEVQQMLETFRRWEQ